MGFLNPLSFYERNRQETKRVDRLSLFTFPALPHVSFFFFSNESKSWEYRKDICSTGRSTQFFHELARPKEQKPFRNYIEDQASSSIWNRSLHQTKESPSKRV